MLSNIQIILASNDYDIIDIFNQLSREKYYNISIYNTIEYFIKAWLSGKYNIAILDLSLFKYHKMNIVEVLNLNSTKSNIVTIGQGEDISNLEKNILAANITPKIIYRMIKPLSYDESNKILNAAIEYAGKLKENSKSNIHEN